jgi:hypothetical protein
MGDGRASSPPRNARVAVEAREWRTRRSRAFRMRPNPLLRPHDSMSYYFVITLHASNETVSSIRMTMHAAPLRRAKRVVV